MERTSKFDIKNFLIKYIFETLVVLIIIALALTTSGFFSFTNIVGILRNMSMIGVLSFGITAIIIAGEIDLSTPSTIALTGIVIALCVKNLPVPSPVAVLIGLIIMIIVGVLVGCVNCYLVLKFKFPSFIATMAVMYVLYGIAAIISNGFPVIGLPAWYKTFGGGVVFGKVPVPAIILVIMFAVTYYIMKYTKMGRSIFAVGGNMEAARLSGIDIYKTKAFSFIFVQFCAIISGVMVSSQVMSGSFNFGKGWDFQAISCVVIGGTAFTGGKGRVWGTFIGLFFYGIVNNAMTLLNVDQYAQYVVRGIIILFAVIINSYRKD